MYNMSFWRNWIIKNRLWAVAAVGAGVGLASVWAANSVFAKEAVASPEIKPTRVVVGETDNTGLRLVLYQYQTCPFCCKVRAYLDYHGLSYEIVEVNPVFRSQIKFSNWRKVPILLAKSEKISDWQQLNESSMIVSALHTFMLDKRKQFSDIAQCYPKLTLKNKDGKDVTEVLNKYDIMLGVVDKRPLEIVKKEKEWRQWADDKLVHTLSPNVYRTPAEALQAFKWFSEVGEWEKHFSFLERLVVIYVGATAMYFIGKRLKKRHELKEDVRQSIYDACNEWIAAIGQGPFLGGKSPNLADLAVYGVLSAIEGCDAFSDVLSETEIKSWYVNIKEAVKQHDGKVLL